MADPVGPVVTGGFEVLVIQDEAGARHALLVLPDHPQRRFAARTQNPVCCDIPERLRLRHPPPATPIHSAASTSSASSTKPLPVLWERKEEGVYGR
jgi:hypothetical protein